MFSVRFIMNDGSNDQVYWYHDLKDADYHFHLFDDDDSDLYFSVEVQDNESTLVRRILGFQDNELLWVLSANKNDLTDLCIYLRDLSICEADEHTKEALIRLRLKVENWPYESYERFLRIIREHVSGSSVSMQKCFRVV